jgi:hypothetical protein
MAVHMRYELTTYCSNVSKRTIMAVHGSRFNVAWRVLIPSEKPETQIYHPSPSRRRSIGSGWGFGCVMNDTGEPNGASRVRSSCHDHQVEFEPPRPGRTGGFHFWGDSDSLGFRGGKVVPPRSSFDSAGRERRGSARLGEADTDGCRHAFGCLFLTTYDSSILPKSVPQQSREGLEMVFFLVTTLMKGEEGRAKAVAVHGIHRHSTLPFCHEL